MEFIYPKNQKIIVSQNTLEKTPYTFQKSKQLHEYDSIEYFFSLVEKSFQKNERKIHMIDIGAQSGLYSLNCKYYENYLTCDAYEPMSTVFHLLEENIELNQIKNVKIFNIGIGDKKEKKILNYDPSHLGLSTCGKVPQRFSPFIAKKMEIDIDTLDNLYFEKKIDFIKCDTEGFELNILKGGEKVIKRDKPEIFLEFNETNCQQCETSTKELNNYLSFLGYSKIKIIDYENIHFSCLN